MKKYYYFMLPCCLIIVFGCSKSSTTAEDIRQIQLSYAETEINTTFRTAGSRAPVIIDWNGEPGTYSISSSTEILQRGHIAFDTLTGVLSWGKNFPIGVYDFSITAKSEGTSTTTEILLTNTFIKGFFSGGFLAAEPDDIDYAADIPMDYGLRLNDDGSISMERHSNPEFLASGTWKITEGGTLSVEFMTNLSGGAITYMRGFLSNSLVELPKFQGKYGTSLDENEEIENLTGIFRFEWD